MRHSKRTVLTSIDVDNALKLRNLEVSCGSVGSCFLLYVIYFFYFYLFININIASVRLGFDFGIFNLFYFIFIIFNTYRLCV